MILYLCAYNGLVIKINFGLKSMEIGGRIKKYNQTWCEIFQWYFFCSVIIFQIRFGDNVYLLHRYNEILLWNAANWLP